MSSTTSATRWSPFGSTQLVVDGTERAIVAGSQLTAGYSPSGIRLAMVGPSFGNELEPGDFRLAPLLESVSWRGPTIAEAVSERFGVDWHQEILAKREAGVTFADARDESLARTLERLTVRSRRRVQERTACLGEHHTTFVV